MVCKLCLHDAGDGANEEKFKLKAPFGRPTNLMKHLKTHDSAQIWLKQYAESLTGSNGIQLSKDDYDLVCWFVTSNSAISEVENPRFRRIVRIELPSVKTFKDKIRKIISNLKGAIEQKVELLNLKNNFFKFFLNNRI
jgi:hypothetical protein